MSAPKVAKAAKGIAFLDEDLAPLDSGTKHRLVVILQIAREQKLENDRLKHVIREQIPAPRRDQGASPASPPPAVLSVLKAWLNTLASGTGPLEMDAPGVRVTRHARPGLVVIPRDVIDALKALCCLEDDATRSLPSSAW